MEEKRPNSKTRIYAPSKNKADHEGAAFLSPASASDGQMPLDEPENERQRRKKDVDEPSFMKGRKPAKKRSTDQKQAREARAQRKLTTAIVAVSFVAILAVSYFVFSVKAFEVVGITRYDEKEIITRSGIPYGQNMLFVDTKAAIRRLQQDPYIEVTSIARALPNQIRITINERQEAAAITYQNLVVIIDANGYVLSIGNRADLTGLVQVRGMQAINYNVNQRLGELTDFYTNTLIAILQALTQHDLVERIAMVDISNPLSVHMQTAQGLDVKLGQAEGLNEKLARLAAVLPDLIAANITEGTLHLSEKNDPVYSPPAALQAPQDPTDPDDQIDPDPTDPDEPMDPDAPVQGPSPSPGETPQLQA